MNYIEANFDGLVGPTHNYAGLSYGNVASANHQGMESRPKEAALQGLEKMYALYKLGFVQGVLAPQERPSIGFLKSLGFKGSDEEIIAAAKDNVLLSLASSAACMWTANAATVGPSADCGDGKVNFTPANLIANAHRAQEVETTSKVLKSIFADEKFFTHHHSLPFGPTFGDEGAANHIRFCENYGAKGLQVFVYGKAAFAAEKSPAKYPARQTLEACQAIARLHGLAEDQVLYLQQSPKVIDEGVFHNDVISVGNGKVLFYHEDTFADGEEAIGKIREKFPSLIAVKVPRAEVSVQDAVSSYLFNTQLLTTSDDGQMCLIAPKECEKNPSVKKYLDKLEKDMSSPINKVHYFEVKQSMSNGGGPACLRLRVVLSAKELAAVNQSCLMTDKLYEDLKSWINKHYRDSLTPRDLADPSLLKECRAALEELTKILDLGPVYPFQA